MIKPIGRCSKLMKRYTVYLQRKTWYYKDVSSLQGLGVGLRGMIKPVIPGPARVCPIWVPREQAEWDSPWWSFPPPQRSFLQAGKDFLFWKSHSWTPHPLLPLLLFLASPRDFFPPAQHFADLFADGKVCSEVTLWLPNAKGGENKLGIWEQHIHSISSR